MKPEKKNVGHMPQKPTFSGMLWTQCHPYNVKFELSLWFTLVYQWWLNKSNGHQSFLFGFFFSSVTYLSDQQYICFM